MKSESCYVSTNCGRATEDMAPDEYDEAGYYGRWAAAMSKLMIEKGVIKIGELRAKLADVPPEDEESGN